MKIHPGVVVAAYAFLAFTFQVVLTYEPEADSTAVIRNAIDALTITVMVLGGFVVFALYRK